MQFTCLTVLAASLLVKDTLANPLHFKDDLVNRDVATDNKPGDASSGNKRGLAYNDVTLLAGFTELPSNKASWAYNWGAKPDGKIPKGLEYVPMLWGLRPKEDLAGWKAAAQSAIDSGSKYLLGNNEPDQDGQALMTPEACAKGWKENMEPFAKSAKLVSPAVTSGPESNKGLAWLGKFLNACSGCTISVIAIHWYDQAANFEGFKKHVTDAHATAKDKPIWITEFAGLGSADEQEAFLKKALPFLDSLSYVERYAYFMVADAKLVSGKTVSKLGKAFATS